MQLFIVLAEIYKQCSYLQCQPRSTNNVAIYSQLQLQLCSWSSSFVQPQLHALTLCIHVHAYVYLQLCDILAAIASYTVSLLIVTTATRLYMHADLVARQSSYTCACLSVPQIIMQASQPSQLYVANQPANYCSSYSYSNQLQLADDIISYSYFLPNIR